MAPSIANDENRTLPLLGAKPDPYGFTLVNAKDKALGKVTRIYVSSNADDNELSLKFTNKQDTVVALIGLNGAQMPASNQGTGDGPTALFLYFGPPATSGVFTAAELAAIGIQESLNWTIKQYA